MPQEGRNRMLIKVWLESKVALLVQYVESLFQMAALPDIAVMFESVNLHVDWIAVVCCNHTGGVSPYYFLSAEQVRCPACYLSVKRA